MRILYVEDDAEVAGFVARNLRAAGHGVALATDGAAGLVLAQTEKFDAIVLDRLLPGAIDGLALLERLRADDDQTPVLFLSALSEVDERVRGLQAGGDDYLAKPFAFPELVARVEALTRRGPGSARGDAPPTRYRVGALEMDLLTRAVMREGRAIALRPREFRLLEFLMRHAGRVVTRTMLLEGVWDYHFDPRTNVIDVHVSNLRRKLDDPFARPMLHSVRGAGFIMRED